jgi:hypothetical protein
LETLAAAAAGAGDWREASEVEQAESKAAAKTTAARERRDVVCLCISDGSGPIRTAEGGSWKALNFVHNAEPGNRIIQERPRDSHFLRNCLCSLRA